MARAFLSYSQKDKESVTKLFEKLKEFARPYYNRNKNINDLEPEINIDIELIEVGDNFVARIERAISLVNYLIIILSENSAQSKWVYYEIGLSKNLRKNQNIELLPVLIDNNPLPPELLNIIGNIHVQKIVNSSEDEWDKSIKQLVKKIYPPDTRYAFDYEIETIWKIHLTNIASGTFSEEEEKRDIDKERSKREAKLALEVIKDNHNKGNPPKVFGAKKDGGHRFWAFFDLLGGRRKSLWISWDTEGLKLVIIKEAITEDSSLRIKWEIHQLKKAKTAANDNKIPKIIQENEEDSIKQEHSNRWFAMELQDYGDLEWQLYPGRLRSDDSFFTEVESLLFKKNLHQIIKQTSAYQITRSKNKSIDWKNLKDKLFIPIAQIIESMHMKDIAHLDIHPSNILISSVQRNQQDQQDQKNNEIKFCLADFDRSVNEYFAYDKEEESSNKFQGDIYPVLKKLRGRGLFDAPERFEKDSFFEGKGADVKMDIFKKCDSYSFGVLLAGVLLNRPDLFVEFTKVGIEFDKYKNDRAKRKDGTDNNLEMSHCLDKLDSLIADIKNSDDLSPQARAILIKTLSKTYTNRPSIKEIIGKLEKSNRWIPIRTWKQLRLVLIAIVTTVFCTFALYGMSLYIDNFYYKVYGETQKEETLNGKIVWNEEDNVLVKGHLFIKDSLIIKPGTIVRMERESSITICQGAYIKAEGTSNSIIAFVPFLGNNSKFKFIYNLFKGDEISPEAGFWGGLTICGPVCERVGNKLNKLEFFSNLDSTKVKEYMWAYGDSTKINKQGSVLSYVVIAYAGDDPHQSTSNSFNALSLAGVDSSTKISNVCIFESGDDGIEFYGGYGRLSNIMIFNTNDDYFDFEERLTSKVQIDQVFICSTNPTYIAGDNGDPGRYIFEGLSEGEKKSFNFKDFTIVSSKQSPSKDTLANTLSDVFNDSKRRGQINTLELSLWFKGVDNSYDYMANDNKFNFEYKSRTDNSTLIPTWLNANFINKIDTLRKHYLTPRVDFRSLKKTYF
ncbi:MAG: TIR domain-containing protein [Bacteroidia bacterium]|nr:TIR domain-containing protein [Bacteroidia bacterium]